MDRLKASHESKPRYHQDRQLAAEIASCISQRPFHRGVDADRGTKTLQTERRLTQTNEGCRVAQNDGIHSVLLAEKSGANSAFKVTEKLHNVVG